MRVALMMCSALPVLFAQPAAAEPEKVAVMPVKVLKSAADRIEREALDEALLAAVQNLGIFSVIGRSDMDAVLGFEKQKDLLGCSDATCFAEIGGALGVDRILEAQVGYADDAWLVSVKLIDVKASTPTVDARLADSSCHGGASKLFAALPSLMLQLVSPAPARAQSQSVASATQAVQQGPAMPQQTTSPDGNSQRSDASPAQQAGATSSKHVRLSAVFDGSHKGIDIPLNEKAPVVAAADGTIERADHDPASYGNYVIVDHGTYKTLYAHLSRVDVKVGQKVFGASILGLSGATGNATRPCLHFEVRVGGEPVDPVAHFLPLVRTMLAEIDAAARRITQNRTVGWVNAMPKRIAPSGYVHIVQATDRLANIARYYRVSEDALRAVNTDLFAYNERETGHRLIINEPILLPTGCVIPKNAVYARRADALDKPATATPTDSGWQTQYSRRTSKVLPIFETVAPSAASTPSTTTAPPR